MDYGRLQSLQGAYNLAEKTSTKYINHDTFTHLSLCKNVLSTYHDIVLSIKESTV